VLFIVPNNPEKIGKVHLNKSKQFFETYPGVKWVS